MHSWDSTGTLYRNGNHYFHPIRFGDVSLDNKLFVGALSISMPRECMNIQMDVPNWATDNNLRANGLYYEGFVDDLESSCSGLSRSCYSNYVWDSKV